VGTQPSTDEPGALKAASHRCRRRDTKGEVGYRLFMPGRTYWSPVTITPTVPSGVAGDQHVDDGRRLTFASEFGAAAQQLAVEALVMVAAIHPKLTGLTWRYLRSTIMCSASSYHGTGEHRGPFYDATLRSGRHHNARPGIVGATT